jgi:peptidoglycan/xylan/chitin deacetylase (PgdA/CDA1 family)
MNSIRQVCKHLLSAAMPPRMLLVRGPRQARGIALTFDDGPHPEHTPRLLDELQKHGIPATFFVVGREAERFPKLVRRIVAEGHALGHHSYTHGDPRDTSAKVLLEEIRRSRVLLEQITGEPSNLFRPPQGKLTGRKLWSIWREGQTVALWNIDPRDYRVRDSLRLREWARQYRPHAGDIVLLHDNQPNALAIVEELAWGACHANAPHPPRTSGPFETHAPAYEFETLNAWLSRPASPAHVPASSGI